MFTALDTKKRLGIETYVIENACKGINDGTMETARRTMIGAGIRLVNSDQLRPILTNELGPGGIFAVVFGVLLLSSAIGTSCYLRKRSSEKRAKRRAMHSLNRSIVDVDVDL